jgi:hypothetical protein
LPFRATASQSSTCTGGWSRTVRAKNALIIEPIQHPHIPPTNLPHERPPEPRTSSRRPGPGSSSVLARELALQIGVLCDYAPGDNGRCRLQGG